MKLTPRGELAQRASAVQQRLDTLNSEIKLAIGKNREVYRLFFEPLQYNVIALFNAAMNPSPEQIGKIEAHCEGLERYFQGIKPRTDASFMHMEPVTSGPIISDFRREALGLEEKLDGLAQKIKRYAAENKLEGDKNLNALWEEGIGLFNGLSGATGVEDVKKIESESVIPYAARVEAAIHPNTGFIWQKRSVPETEDEMLRFKLERINRRLIHLEGKLAEANGDIETMKTRIAMYANAFKSMLDLFRKHGFRVELIEIGGIMCYGIGKQSDEKGEWIINPESGKTTVN